MKEFIRSLAMKVIVVTN